MDPWLAKVYGTNMPDSEDLEKIAQAEMAQSLAQQEGIDLSGLSEAQLAALGQEVLGQNQGQEVQAAAQAPSPAGAPQQGMGGEQGPTELTPELIQQAQEILSAPPGEIDPEVVQQAQAILQIAQQQQGAPQQAGGPAGPAMAKVAEAQANFEEADFLGRVMAHAFNQESEKIASQKTAGMLGQAAHAVDRTAQSAGRKLFGAVARTGGAEAKMAPNAARAIGYGAGAAGLGAGGALAHKAMHEKQAAVAVIEKAAEKLAAEILLNNGIDPTTGAPLAPAAPAPAAPAVSPPAAPEALGDLVEKRAHQILRGLGYKI